MKKINLNLIALMMLALMISFSSCTKEEIGTDEVIETEVDLTETEFNSLLDNIEGRDDSDSLALGCFTIDTPFSLDIDGNIVVINDLGELESVLVFDSTEVIQNVDFVYPLAITYENGESGEVANALELGEAFSQCIPDEGWTSEEPGEEGDFPAYLICEFNSCYQLAYPVTVVGLDGTTYTANNEEEFIDLLTSEDYLTFEFPVNLEGEDGETASANDSNELFDLLLSCQEDNPWGGDDIDSTWTDGDLDFDFGSIGCYNPVFPLSITTIDGGIIIVNDEEELITELLNGNVNGFSYPMSLVNIFSGEEITVNNEEEFNAALEDCGFGFDDDGSDDNSGDWDWDNEDWDGENSDSTWTEDNFIHAAFFYASLEEEACYSINYPVDVTTDSGELITINSPEDFDTLLFGSSFTINFDVVVTLDSGETSTLSSEDDIFNLFISCSE